MNFLNEDEVNTLPFELYNQVESKIILDINEHNFYQFDERLDRNTQALPGHFTIIDRPVIKELLEGTPLSKYREDWDRIQTGLEWCIKEALDNPDSRRLMCFNTKDYYHVFPCFISFHFVLTHRGEYDMYVYQRSSDVSKLKDDFIFFAHVAEHFELNQGIPVTKIAVVDGHIHYEIK